MAKLSVDQTLLKAKSHTKRGEIEEAHKLYQNVLQAFPNNGRAQKGLEALRKTKAPATNQNPPQELLDRLLEHYQNGRFDEAEKLAVSITQKYPRHQVGWKALGAIYLETGKTSDSLIPNQKSVQFSPIDAEAHFSLGNTLKKLGRLDEALASCNKAIALKPDFAEAHNNLGNTLQELGRLDEAEASYMRALALKPNYAKARNNLGNTLQELGRLDEAEASYMQALALKPDYAEAYCNLGNALQELGRLDEAEARYLQALALEPAHANTHSNLGNTLQELGRLEEAVASYTQAIVIKPNFAEAYNNLGNTLQELGRFKEAEASFMQAIALQPDYTEAHRHLTLIRKSEFKDDNYFEMRKIYLDANTSEEQLCQINFALAKVCDDLGDFEQAFTHYKEGNALRKKSLGYDVLRETELFKKLECSYQKIEKNALDSKNLASSVTPIFIVGMPRSGTTLVEQIISSHKQVTGAGELKFVSKFGTQLATGAAEIDQDSLFNFRKNYLNKLETLSEGNRFVCDKMPQNFQFIGLIAAAFPEAKIIHVKRDPAAVCWANYKQYFPSKHIRFCYALEDIVHYYCLYNELTDFWINSLNNRIFDLDYELLVKKQETETRKLLGYLELDWDKQCLSPHQNTRSVATASNLQVREKIYKGSSQKWKKYEPFLNGAFDSLLPPLIRKQPQN